MKRYIRLFIFLLFITAESFSIYDLAIVGPLKLADGIGRISFGIYESLKNDVRIIFKPSEKSEKDINFFKINSRFRDSFLSQVLIATDPCSRFTTKRYLKILSKGRIRFAYSMFESTELPGEMVQAINTKFDGVLVGDHEIKKIYENNGVQKPVFVLPCPTFLDNLLHKPIKNKSGKIFTFGASGRMLQSKNFEKILLAFAEEFGNSSSVKLILHSRLDWTYPKIKENLDAIIKQKKLSNVEIIYKNLSTKEYEDFISNLDCYICISRGEGFSFSPREAMAAGIPVILSNNTAHKVICESGMVLPIDASIKVPAYYELMNKQYGLQFDCKLIDVKNAMWQMYENYSFFLKKAKRARVWVKQYLPVFIRPYLLSLVKPQRVIFGKENKIKKSELITNDFKLYKKYKYIKKI